MGIKEGIIDDAGSLAEKTSISTSVVSPPRPPGGEERGGYRKREMMNRSVFVVSRITLFNLQMMQKMLLLEDRAP